MFLSIIIAVYNAEKYISNCLDSLLHQDVEKTDYEIICIDDGSTDASTVLLKQYAQTYPNIRVLEKSNGGASSARNLGLSMALGQYVWFIDSDDWIARNCLRFIQQQIDQHNPSVIQVHYDWIKAEWRIRECWDKLLDTQNVHWSVHSNTFMQYDGAWSTIIHKRLLLRYNHIFYENLHYGEDILFIRDLFDSMRLETESGDFAHQIMHLQNEIIYYYRLHEKSAMQIRWSKNRQKYAQAMLDLARINKERMHDSAKPGWYTEQYEKLFGQRMYSYLIHWLPGLYVNIGEHMKMLRREKLYPVPASICRMMYKELTESTGVTAKIKNMYIYLVLRCKWLYLLYYWQMKKQREN